MHPGAGFHTSPAISVIIPAFNRPSELRLCLEGFASQTTPSNQFEVVVVDDGSTVELQSATSGFAGILNLQFIRIPHGGPGAARNAGIKRANAPLLILYDDDQRPLPDLVAYCIAFHRNHPLEHDTALLYFEIDPAVATSPFARWAFDKLYPFPREVGTGGWNLFWTGTLTCKKCLFRHGEFDSSYKMLEDAELGLRLSSHLDLRVHFEPHLTGTMIRQLGLEQFCRRQYMLGYFTHVFARQYRGTVDFTFPPYGQPERYFMRDRGRLAALLAAARFDGGNDGASKLLRAAWSTLDLQVRAEGWMTACDGRPPDPPGTLGLLLLKPTASVA